MIYAELEFKEEEEAAHTARPCNCCITDVIHTPAYKFFSPFLLLHTTSTTFPAAGFSGDPLEAVAIGSSFLLCRALQHV